MECVHCSAEVTKEDRIYGIGNFVYQCDSCKGLNYLEHDIDGEYFKECKKTECSHCNDAAFDNADFYDCLEHEELNHITVEDAIEDWLDWWYPDSKDVEKFLADNTPLTVTAYARHQISDAEIKARCDVMVEELVSGLSEQYGDPGDEKIGVNREHEKELVSLITPIVKGWIEKHVVVWPCSEVATREYSEAEVMAIVRENRPEWLEEEGAAND